MGNDNVVTVALSARPADKSGIYWRCLRFCIFDLSGSKSRARVHLFTRADFWKNWFTKYYTLRQVHGLNRWPRNATRVRWLIHKRCNSTKLKIPCNVDGHFYFVALDFRHFRSEWNWTKLEWNCWDQEERISCEINSSLSVPEFFFHIETKINTRGSVKKWIWKIIDFFVSNFRFEFLDKKKKNLITSQWEDLI